MFTGGRLARSKVDYYPGHIFIRILSHLPQQTPRSDGTSFDLHRTDFHSLKALASATFFKVPLLGADPNTVSVEGPSKEETQRWLSQVSQVCRMAFYPAYRVVIAYCCRRRRPKLPMKHWLMHLKAVGACRFKGSTSSSSCDGTEPSYPFIHPPLPSASSTQLSED